MSDKEVIMGIDVANNIYRGYEMGYYYGEERLRQLVRNCAEAGIGTIYWRVSATGQVTYQSKVRTIIGTKPNRVSGFQAGSVENLIVRQCDPPAVAVDEAKKCGLKLFAYVTLFDEYYPGMESQFEVDHPEYTWKHFSKDHHIRGLLSYAYPEVREHRLAELRELIEYGVDGIYLDTARSHTGIQPILALPLREGSLYWNYGYNQPEVEAFRQETGLDPLEVDRSQDFYAPVHEEKYHRFRGRYLTQFLREARALTNKAKIELAVGFYTDASCYLSPAGQRGRAIMGRFHHEYEKWVDEDIVDSIVLIAEHRRCGARDWRENSEAQFKDARAKGKNVYIWTATEAVIDQMEDPPGELPLNITVDRELFLKGLDRTLAQCFATSADGIYLYEADALDRFDYWQDLAGMLRSHGC